ncbi:hypothetical protein [Asaia sp. HN010]|uniref:hypothetical protein n=1 Tax=Asaia sp. HN010 TaxID=3081233 RepID=UPI003015E21D
MDCIALSLKKACVLVVSLAGITPVLRDGIETQMRKQVTRTQDLSVVFHHLEGARPDLPAWPATPDAKAVNLAELLTSLINLKLVVTFGVAAHLSTLDAYGIGWARVPFRPGRITALPDGLVLVNFPVVHGKHVDTIDQLLAQIPPALEAALSV